MTCLVTTAAPGPLSLEENKPREIKENSIKFAFEKSVKDQVTISQKEDPGLEDKIIFFSKKLVHIRERNSKILAWQ